MPLTHGWHPTTALVYSMQNQMTHHDPSTNMKPNNQTTPQEVLGTHLFYGRAVDNTTLTALGTLATAQTKGTEQTMDKLVQLMDYSATYPDAKV